MEKQNKPRISSAWAFILLFGVVSLLSDLTHEGAASIQGSYLSLIGASATAIGFISGLGELLGYSLRLLFGRIADRTGKYWLLTIIGYALDILAVPLLGLVGPHGWILACILISVQRIGKAIKKPSKDTIMSFAATQERVGRSFAIQELLDQIGAFLGPLFLYLIMLFQADEESYRAYSACFLFLAIPALACLGMLFFTKKKFPNPDRFEPEAKGDDGKLHMRPSFVLYIIGISIFAFGFVDYSLIGMHISEVYVTPGGIINDATLPLLYSYAMAIDALSALAFGKLFDKAGMWSLLIAGALSAPFSAFIFLFKGLPTLFIGLTMWGIGMGAQESILKAAVTTMVPKRSRATGYGAFEFSFGIAWFCGSFLLGALYDLSLPAMAGVSIAFGVLPLPFYAVSGLFKRRESQAESADI